MRLFALTLCVAWLVPGALGGQDVHWETVRRVLTTTPLIDGHNDLPGKITRGDLEAYHLMSRPPSAADRELVRLGYVGTHGETDIERLRLGMVGAQFWSLNIAPQSTYGLVRNEVEHFDVALRMFDAFPSDLEQAFTASDIERIFHEGKVASIIGIEGGHAIENSLPTLRVFYRLGARYLTLTHHVSNDWAESWADEANGNGLTEFGKEVVREMNRLGMLVDLSHTSVATMSEALDVSEAPVIFSHSNARAVTHDARNVPDSILERISTNGGIVMATFVTRYTSDTVREYHLRENAHIAELQGRYGSDQARVDREMEAWHRDNPLPRATLSQVADHVEYIRRVAGIDHVGIGSDFDGLAWVVQGLEDVSTFPALFVELSRRGWTESELRKLAGENLLRVLREVEQVALRLQRERQP